MGSRVKKTGAFALAFTLACASTPARPGPQSVAGAVDAANAAPVTAPPLAHVDTHEIGPHTVERYHLGGVTILLGIDRWATAYVYETWFGVGLADDPPGREGQIELAFQLAHPRADVDTLSKLEDLGARVRAGLGPDWTVFGVTARGGADAPYESVVRHHTSHLRRAHRADFRAASVAARQTLRRLRRRDVRSQLEEALFANLFPAGSAAARYGTPTLARQVGLLALSEADVRSFVEETFAPQRGLIVAVGDIDRARLLTAIRVHVGPHATSTRDAARPAAPAKDAAVAASIDLRIPAKRELGLVGWPLSKTGDVALEAASIHLAAGHLVSLRDAIQAHSIDTWTVRHRHGGAFAVLVTAGGTSTATTAVGGVVQALGLAGAVPPTDDELIRTQAELRGRTWRALDGLEDRAQHLAVTELSHGGVQQISDRLDAIDALAPDDLVRAIRARVLDVRPVTIIGRPRRPSP